MKKIVNVFTKKEIKILANEFIVVTQAVTKENLHIELLKFLRQIDIRINNAECFEQLYETIETKYL